MADKQKFEKMLELLVNEDREGATELFHEIVVEQSRTIYETILEADLDDEDVDESDDDDLEDDDDDDVDESEDDDLEEDDDDDDDLEEDFDLGEFEVEADPTDNLMKDVSFGGDDDEEDDDSDDMGDMGDEDDDGDIGDRVVDLEDALDDLKAEFNKMMGDDDEEDDDSDDSDDDQQTFGGDDEEDDDSDDGEDDDDNEEEGYEFEDFSFESDDDDDEGVTERKKTQGEVMREYVDKINGGGLDNNSVLGKTENGANTKSTVASKNDMGGTSQNILRTDTENSGEANKGNIKGSALNDQNKKEDSHGNVNVPGGKAAKSNKPMPKGHGTEKKGAADTAPNKRSLIGSKK